MLREKKSILCAVQNIKYKKLLALFQNDADLSFKDAEGRALLDHYFLSDRQKFSDDRAKMLELLLNNKHAQSIYDFSGYDIYYNELDVIRKSGITAQLPEKIICQAIFTLVNRPPKGGSYVTEAILNIVVPIADPDAAVDRTIRESLYYNVQYHHCLK
ncbi:MAG: hypothetical protein LLG04_13280 [Parachlamydia sp.]|nr:hypothetical protein [Parachlamydia sp.]